MPLTTRQVFAGLQSGPSDQEWLIKLRKLIKLTWTPHVVVLEAALESRAVCDADDAQTLPHAPRKLPLVRRQRRARLQEGERPEMYASCTRPRLPSTG